MCPGKMCLGKKRKETNIGLNLLSGMWLCSKARPGLGPEHPAQPCSVLIPHGLCSSAAECPELRSQTLMMFSVWRSRKFSFNSRVKLGEIKDFREKRKGRKFLRLHSDISRDYKDSLFSWRSSPFLLFLNNISVDYADLSSF